VDFGGYATIGRPDWKKTYSVHAQYRREQFEKVLKFTESQQCRMSALVAHFGDFADARLCCGKCDVCDPAGAVLRLFRRATTTERHWVQDVLLALRGAAYKTVKRLIEELDWAEGMGRNDFEELLNAISRAGLIDVENAEFEKDGKVIPYRRITLTEAGEQVRPTTPLPLLISDGVVEDFATPAQPRTRGVRDKVLPGKKAKAPSAEPVALTPDAEALAVRLREWRAAEARRLRVPAFVVLHDRTLTEVARARPANPNQLLAIDGIGPAKAEKFGPAILAVCGTGN
jgi:superfamily II DNA helicase RecQ